MICVKEFWMTTKSGFFFFWTDYYSVGHLNHDSVTGLWCLGNTSGEPIYYMFCFCSKPSRFQAYSVANSQSLFILYHSCPCYSHAAVSTSKKTVWAVCCVNYKCTLTCQVALVVILRNLVWLTRVWTGWCGIVIINWMEICAPKYSRLRVQIFRQKLIKLQFDIAKKEYNWISLRDLFSVLIHIVET